MWQVLVDILVTLKGCLELLQHLWPSSVRASFQLRQHFIQVFTECGAF